MTDTQTIRFHYMMMMTLATVPVERSCQFTRNMMANI